MTARWSTLTYLGKIQRVVTVESLRTRVIRGYQGRHIQLRDAPAAGPVSYDLQNDVSK